MSTDSNWAKLGAAAAALGICWLIAGIAGAQPGYDASWHLIWAQDLIAGRLPKFDAWAAPTEHPLMLALCLLCAPFGKHAPQALIALELFGLLLIAPLLARLTAATMGSRAAGFAGWVLLAGAYGLLLAALRGYLDVWFVLLTVWGAARWAEGNRPASGAAQFALAGLLRPEAWLLAGAAAVIQWRSADRRGAWLLAAAAVAPALVWFGFDAATAGNPLLSLSTASTLALEGDGGGPIKVFAVSMLGGIRGPATLLGACGLALAIRNSGTKILMPAIALAATGLVAAAAISIAGLTLLPRYLMLTWVGAATFGGFALFGWTSLPAEGLSTSRWRALGVGAAVLGAIGAVGLGAPAKLTNEVSIDSQISSDLQTLLAQKSVGAGAACGPITFPSFRLVPDAILALDDRSIEVRARGQQPKPTAGVAVLVTTRDETLLGRYSHPGIKLPIDEKVPTGFEHGFTAGSLTAFVRCNPPSQ
jgi:hypothetical protein